MKSVVLIGRILKYMPLLGKQQVWVYAISHYAIIKYLSDVFVIPAVYCTFIHNELPFAIYKTFASNHFHILSANLYKYTRPRC